MNALVQRVTIQQAPQAPPAPVDADRLAQQIEQQVEQALQQSLGKADQAEATREGVRAAMDRMRAELEAARAQGRQVVIQPSAQDMIPPQAVDISLAFFTMIAFIVVGLPLARAFARRMDRRGQAAAATDPDVAPRLQRIEQAVDAIAVEVERISENQRYSTRLIADMRGLPSASAGNWEQRREAEPVPREGQIRRP